MGQIVGGAAKPKRCNLNKLSQLETPASGEHILVSSDNSMNAAGQGNFDCYIVGDGTKAATALPLIKTYANEVDDEPTAGSDNLAKSGGVRKYIEELRQILNITGVKEVLANTYSAGYYSGSVGGTISEITNNGKKYAPVSIPANSSGKKVFIAVYNYSSGSSRIGAITNSSDVILKSYVENSPLFVNNDIAYYTMDISDDASKLYISVNSNAVVLYAIVADSYNIKEIQNSIQRNNSNIQSNTSGIIELKAELQIPFGQNTVASVVGVDYNNEVTVSIPANTTFIVKTIGTSNLRNYFLTINGTNEGQSRDVTLEKTYGYDVTSIKIWRNGSNVIAAGDISLIVLPKSDSKSIMLNQMNNLIEQNASDIDDDNAKIDGIYGGIKVESVLNGLIHLDSGYYYNYNSVTPVQHSGKYTKPENALDISEYAGKFIRITYTGYSDSSLRSCLVTDANDNILAHVLESQFVSNGDGTYYKDLQIPVSAAKLYISFSNDVTSYNFVVASTIKLNLVYVDAENGSDSNSGKEGSPLASFQKALNITGEDTTIIFSGETNETIDVRTKSGQRSLTIIGKYGHINRINKGKKLENISTYSTGIYQANVSNFTDGKVLFQHGVNDVQTLIDDNERLPQQRGMEYRCEHTRLIQKSSLSALEESQEYAYYYSSAESKIYFKPASTDFENHPIIIPSTSYGIGNNDGSVKVEIVNMEFLYCYANLDRCHGAVIKDCKAGYCVNGAGFRYNLAVGITFEKCEAVRVRQDNVGDGFNAHANLNSTEFGNAPIFSKHVTATLIDCWSHDNQDDGYSDHERSETVIRGGLFEYNGKAGITPSYGSHCCCYNVISRNNFRGFYYTGAVSDVTPPEGGKYGQMLCVCCIAKSNTNDAGFSVQGAGNRMILKDCLSINHTNGYFADSGTNALLYNCKGMDNTNATAGSGTITVKNGSEIV